MQTVHCIHFVTTYDAINIVIHERWWQLFKIDIKWCTATHTFISYRHFIYTFIGLTRFDSRNERINAISFHSIFFFIFSTFLHFFFISISGSLLRYFCYEWCLLLKSRANKQYAGPKSQKNKTVAAARLLLLLLLFSVVQ